MLPCVLASPLPQGPTDTALSPTPATPSPTATNLAAATSPAATAAAAVAAAAPAGCPHRPGGLGGRQAWRPPTERRTRGCAHAGPSAQPLPHPHPHPCPHTRTPTKP